jgi:deaminated glutathione amidase
MTGSLRVGLVQMRSGRLVGANVVAAVDLIREAESRGAQYVQTPEATTCLDLDRAALLAQMQPEARNDALETFVALARELKIWLHIGSMAVLAGDRLANRAYVIAPDGSIAARYDKIHMFDVQLANGERYEESANYQAGARAVAVDLPWGRLGLAICYDLRFPGLFRQLAQAGAVFLSVPAAFTQSTGEVHWHTLLRARAIEAQCFLFAAAQGGLHEHGRSTFGHSLIVSPWGTILAEGGVEPGVIVTDIDLSEVGAVRARIPSLQHDRAFTVEVAKAE